ncbi:MAG: preprotein translocase subunit YajC [Treponema sp.]|jgi:preprotein translocase subunit YajC|nr:preprotein translocase subunit YajC [Treponema sp.]
MNQLFFSLLMAAPGGGQSSPQQTIIGMLPIVAIVAIFYFLIIRPQNKKQKETQKMLQALKKGDRIVTIGGIHGVIQSVREGTVILKVDENCKIEFTRSAIATIEAVAKDKDSGEPAE